MRSAETSTSVMTAWVALEFYVVVKELAIGELRESSGLVIGKGRKVRFEVRGRSNLFTIAVCFWTIWVSPCSTRGRSGRTWEFCFFCGSQALPRLLGPMPCLLQRKVCHGSRRDKANEPTLPPHLGEHSPANDSCRPVRKPEHSSLRLCPVLSPLTLVGQFREHHAYRGGRSSQS